MSSEFDFKIRKEGKKYGVGVGVVVLNSNVSYYQNSIIATMKLAIIITITLTPIII